MSLSIASLNSGSNGNCYYIGNQSEAVLIDAGICCKEIEKRMNRLGLAVQKLKAVFISHEHTDHTAGIKTFSKKYKLPVYITQSTLYHARLVLEKHLITFFNMHQPVTIGNLTITAFPKLHDAAEPCSFIIEHSDVRVGVFTDIGAPCEHVTKYFEQCHAAFLETNYDVEMLRNGSYPYVLKRRISSDRGHLGNHQALELFKKYKPPFMTHLFLSHLSKNNNSPVLVEELFTAHAGNVKIILASRYRETALYYISHDTQAPARPQRSKSNSVQLSLAFS